MTRYFIEFASVKRTGTIVREEYESLTEAKEVALTLREQGKYPTIHCVDKLCQFKCIPMVTYTWSQGQRKERREWCFSFPSSDGLVRSVAANCAGDNGVRYANHRKGYRASLHAMDKFAKAWDRYISNRILAGLAA